MEQLVHDLTSRCQRAEEACERTEKLVQSLVDEVRKLTTERVTPPPLVSKSSYRNPPHFALDDSKPSKGSPALKSTSFKESPSRAQVHEPSDSMPSPRTLRKRPSGLYGPLEQPVISSATTNMESPTFINLPPKGTGEIGRQKMPARQRAVNVGARTHRQGRKKLVQATGAENLNGLERMASFHALAASRSMSFTGPSTSKDSCLFWFFACTSAEKNWCMLDPDGWNRVAWDFGVVSPILVFLVITTPFFMCFAFDPSRRHNPGLLDFEVFSLPVSVHNLRGPRVCYCHFSLLFARFLLT